MICEIAAVAGACLLAVVVARLTVWLHRTGQRRPACGAPYAGFAGEAGHTVFLLPCEGLCAVPTAHEDDGDGTAACVTCGTGRPTHTDGA